MKERESSAGLCLSRAPLQLRARTHREGIQSGIDDEVLLSRGGHPLE